MHTLTASIGRGYHKDNADNEKGYDIACSPAIWRITRKTRKDGISINAKSEIGNINIPTSTS